MMPYAFENLWQDVVGSLFAGAVAGAVAILLYGATKRHENRVNKRDMASILYGEISEFASDYGNENAKSGIKPSTLIYEGLLSSGNIKFFSQDMQRELYSLYVEFDRSSLSVDETKVAKMMKRLESVIDLHSKRRYFFMPDPR